MEISNVFIRKLFVLFFYKRLRGIMFAARVKAMTAETITSPRVMVKSIFPNLKWVTAVLKRTPMNVPRYI
jgi:hypothetical protein